MNPGTSELEAKQRVIDVAEEIIPLINNKLSRIEAVQIISDRYGVGERQAENYLYRAYKILHDEVMENQESVLGSIITAYKNLLEKALEMEDYKEYRQVLKDFHEALGLKKNRIEISGDMKDLFKAIEGLAVDDNNG